jgi:hypothetical protein
LPSSVELIVGVDPGIGGGICFLFPDGTVRLYNMPDTDDKVWQLLRRIRCYDSLIVLEKISPGFPGTGKTQMAKLYGSYRMLRGMLTVLRRTTSLRDGTDQKTHVEKCCLVEALSRVWQKRIGFISKDQGVKRKRLLKQYALSFFDSKCYPSLKITLKTCDALLLAEYGRRLIDEA